ncbi:MAG: DUF1810 domain-containing protein [Candidatus Riflebacteria bacterium]|nr:DUF1810 domain-containing protein [Candidatus Riflebacteria bacterium]
MGAIGGSGGAVPDNGLDRFLDGQEGVYPRALAEIRAGEKRSHWMWFIFPQLVGLGHSATARFYGIRDLAEARAFLVHPVLGARLRECAEALLTVTGRDASDIFGYPDDVKLRSSMTLFAAAAGPDSVFHRVLDRFFPSGPDPRTLDLLNRPPPSAG